MRQNYHGGGCCGVRHVHDFAYETSETFERNYRDLHARMTPHGMEEVILTRRQLVNKPGLAEALQREGFKYVNRFKNPNSRNVCYVFHKVLQGCNPSIRTRLPFAIVGPNEDN